MKSLLALIALLLFPTTPMPEDIPESNTIRYVALGDSYTIGTGIDEADNYPTQLVEQLQSEGIPIELIANPAIGGRTTEDVLLRQLDVFRASNADFVTLLIGTNDTYQFGDADKYRTDLAEVVAQLLLELSADQILLITTPDYSLTPSGGGYASAADIAAYNQVIIDLATESNIALVDIFSLSQEQAGDDAKIAPDGLHYTREAYAEWAQLMLPTVRELLH